MKASILIVLKDERTNETIFAGRMFTETFEIAEKVSTLLEDGYFSNGPFEGYYFYARSDNT